LKGGNSRWQRNAKKPRRKNQQKEKGINALNKTPNRFWSSTETLTREEIHFFSRFFYFRRSFDLSVVQFAFFVRASL